MPLVRFEKLCLDANDPALAGRFWAAVLDRQWRPDGKGGGAVFGPTPQHTLEINAVPEPKSVKHRVHLDVYATDLADLAALGARVLHPAGDDRSWTVMADAEGGEFCAFLRSDLPPERLHGLVVDSSDPARAAQWWADVYGAGVIHDDRGFSTVEGVAGMPIATMDFVPVPEPKTASNRIQWDVATDDVGALVAAGASLLRSPGGDLSRHVLADPEGNEFRAFLDEPGR